MRLEMKLISIPARGYSLTFKTPKDDSAELTKFGERMYDHLIMYAPSTKSRYILTFMSVIERRDGRSTSLPAYDYSCLSST